MLKHLKICSPKRQGTKKSSRLCPSEPPVGAARVETHPDSSFYRSLCLLIHGLRIPLILPGLLYLDDGFHFVKKEQK